MRAIKTLLAFVACLPVFAAAFNVVPSSGISVGSRQRASKLNMSKGFDKSAKPQRKQVSAGQAEREKMSSNYDKIAATGGQEYSIFVRQFGGEDGSWLPCGSIAVPRNAQVSDAIFANEENLKISIVRTFPKLKGYEAEFEYGYNLKMFPDDPVEVATKQTKVAGPSVGNWLSNLLSPVDASGAAPPTS